MTTALYKALREAKVPDALATEAAGSVLQVNTAGFATKADLVAAIAQLESRILKSAITLVAFATIIVLAALGWAVQYITSFFPG